MQNTVPPCDPQGNLVPKKVYIYILSSPLTPEVIRYVGKTIDPQRRLTQHIQDMSNTHKGHWLTLLHKQGLTPMMTIIEETDFQHWDKRESYWITYYMEHGHPLTNAFLGSRGPGIIDLETRAKMAAAHRGKKQTPAHIAKRTVSQRGKTIRPETREKLSESRKGIAISPETRVKMAVAKTGKKSSPESNAKRSASLKGRKVPPETVAKSAASKRGSKHSVESRAKISASLRGKKRSAMKKSSPSDEPTL